MQTQSPSQPARHQIKDAPSTEVPNTDDPDPDFPKHQDAIPSRPYVTQIHKHQFIKPTPVGDPALLAPNTASQRKRSMVGYPPASTSNFRLGMAERSLDKHDAGEAAEQVRLIPSGFDNLEELIQDWADRVKWYEEQTKNEIKETRELQAFLAVQSTQLSDLSKMLWMKRYPIHAEAALKKSEQQLEARVKSIQAQLDRRFKAAQKFYVDHWNGMIPLHPSTNRPAEKAKELPSREENPILYISSRDRLRCRQSRYPFPTLSRAVYICSTSAPSTPTPHMTRPTAPSSLRRQSDVLPAQVRPVIQGVVASTHQEVQQEAPITISDGPELTQIRHTSNARLSSQPLKRPPRPPIATVQEAHVADLQKPADNKLTDPGHPTDLIDIPEWFLVLDKRNIIPLTEIDDARRYIELGKKMGSLDKRATQQEADASSSKQDKTSRWVKTTGTAVEVEAAHQGSKSSSFPLHDTAREQHSFIVAAIQDAKEQFAKEPLVEHHRSYEQAPKERNMGQCNRKA